MEDISLLEADVPGGYLQKKLKIKITMWFDCQTDQIPANVDGR